MDKIVKDDMPRYAIKDLKEVLHDRKIATETERQLKEKEAKRLALEKAKRLQAEKEIKEKESKGLALERPKYKLFLTNINHVHQKHLMRRIHRVQAKMPI